MQAAQKFVINCLHFCFYFVCVVLVSRLAFLFVHVFHLIFYEIGH